MGAERRFFVVANPDVTAMQVLLAMARGPRMRRWVGLCWAKVTSPTSKPKTSNSAT
jgi:hypothetical protein